MIPSKDPLDKQLLELCRKGEKLAAVKLYKDSTGEGLKESKDYVDELAAKHGIEMKSGCFIATACYGDYDAPEVVLLRHYRDQNLLKHTAGKIFVKIYYSLSPPAARLLERSETLRSFVRKYLLKPLTRRLS